MCFCFSVPLIHVDGGESEDEELVTVVEKEKIDVDKKVIIVTDKYRTVEKMLMPDNLDDFLNQGINGRLGFCFKIHFITVGRETIGYSEDEEVYAVLEEDGTEVDEAEYFQLLPARSRLIVLSTKEIWSPMNSMQGCVLLCLKT